MVAEHIFSVNINHFWKDCKPKCNTLRTKFTKQSTQLSPEGRIACLFKQVMNPLDSNLFNSSLIFRNLKPTNLVFSYVG